LETQISESAVASLLSQAKVEGDFKLHLLNGGANNRIFRVEAGNKQFLLKIYFQHPNDVRDRLGAEFSFSKFAWDHEIHSLPQPFACNHRNSCALYEFVEGRPLMPHDVSGESIQQALHFYHQLNQCKTSARALPKASEACFTTGEHLQCVERRLHLLKQTDTSLDHEASLFIVNELSQAWSRVSDFVRKRCISMGLPLDREIADQDKCISPSDFGFHNAILTHTGNLHFIDFEYAGWDDPAKMVCDFFCQPAIPVPMDYFDLFSQSIVLTLQDPKIHLERINLLFPVYQIKWCCILLNDFVPAGSSRRQFALGSDDQEERKRKQLKKAQQALENLTVLR